MTTEKKKPFQVYAEHAMKVVESKAQYHDTYKQMLQEVDVETLRQVFAREKIWSYSGAGAYVMGQASMLKQALKTPV